MGPRVYGERAFQLFITALRPHTRRLMVMGRLEPQPGVWHYELPDDVDFVGLPHYASLARPATVLRGLAGALWRFWRALDDLDVVWLLGPHPYALGFAVLALARRRRVVLGVRQDLPRYVRSRRPGRKVLHVAADVMDAAWRLLGRGVPVVVVGPELAARYHRSRELLSVNVSLVSARDLVVPDEALVRWRDSGERRIVTVGRLDSEKNPLLLADVLARLQARRQGDRWRLVVCGDGPMRAALEQRLTELGVRADADLRGYVAQDEGLRDVYRSGHAFLHVSWTEGVPQVLFEAFAAGLPVVATAVGGVAATAEGAALLMAPGDADAAVSRLERIAGDPVLRERLVRAGAERVRGLTREAESARVARFLAGGPEGRPG
jgi:glycosyltransferase involved in cell wall biosynthesis